jgi:hypothetical protein
LTIGATTREQVESILGEPTNFSDSVLGSTLQYWYGDFATPGNFRTILVNFNPQGIFDGATTTEVPYPSCWREQD